MNNALGYVSFWPWGDFAFRAGGLIVVSWQSISNEPPSVYVVFCWGIARGDIHKKGGMARVAELPQVFAVFWGKRLTLELMSLHAGRIL